MEYLLVVNPRARQIAVQPDLWKEIQRSLASFGAEAELQLTRLPGEATEIARGAARRGCKTVVVAGGDGTINEVVNGLANTETAMGVIPLGTGNIVGRYLGLETGDIQSACKLIAETEVTEIDLGCINGRYFVNMAGIGLDAKVAEDVNSQWKNWIGPYAFISQFLATAAAVEPWLFTAEIDGKQRKGSIWAVFVSNTPLYTWRVQLVPDADETDGLLDFVLFHRCPREMLFKESADVFIGGKTAAHCEHMEVVQGKRLHLTMAPQCPWQVEGEVGGRTPVDCWVEPNALRIRGRRARTWDG